MSASGSSVGLAPVHDTRPRPPGIPAWPVRAALRGAALAFAIAGFVRAATVAVAGHTERAVIDAGALAPLARTAVGAAVVGTLLALVAVALGLRWLRDVTRLSGTVRRGRIAWPATLHQRLAGRSERGFRVAAIAVAGMTLAAAASALAALVVGRQAGQAPFLAGLGLEVLGAGLAVVASGLGVWVVDRLEELVLDRTSPFARPLSARRRGIRALPIVALLGLSLYPAVTIATATAHDQVNCPGLPGGDCRRVTVELDRTGADRSRTLSIIFRVAPATGSRLGTLFVATGGPGVRGLSEADPRLAQIDPAILARYDVVFFDERGVGGSDGFDCPSSVGAYLQDVADDGLAATDQFVDACLQELGPDASRLPYMGTSAAADDIDAIRESLGLDRIALYGESYGTLLAQTYAARYPNRVSALILDGAIDAVTPSLDFWSEAARGFASTLTATLDACSASPACRTDMAGGDPQRDWQQVVERLRQGAVQVEYPDGFALHDAAITLAQLYTAAGRALYDETARMELLRAVAAASHGDWLLLDRLVVVGLPQPVTGLVGSRAPTFGLTHLEPWTPTAYRAVECADVDAPALGATAFDRADRAAADAGIFADLVRQDSGCLRWPRPIAGARPLAALPATVRTLVLAATADPITPLANAQRIVARSNGTATLLVTDGGPHVSYGTGSACVDDAVRALLLDGTLASGRIDCHGRVADDYVPLPAASAAAFETGAAGIADVARQLGALPEVTSWDRLGSLRVGCPVAGYVRLYGFPDGVTLFVSGCSFVPGFTVSGSGSMDPVDGRISLDVTRDD